VLQRRSNAAQYLPMRPITLTTFYYHPSPAAFIPASLRFACLSIPGLSRDFSDGRRSLINATYG